MAFDTFLVTFNVMQTFLSSLTLCTLSLTFKFIYDQMTQSWNQFWTSFVYVRNFLEYFHFSLLLHNPNE